MRLCHATKTAIAAGICTTIRPGLPAKFSMFSCISSSSAFFDFPVFSSPHLVRFLHRWSRRQIRISQLVIGTPCALQKGNFLPKRRVCLINFGIDKCFRCQVVWLGTLSSVPLTRWLGRLNLSRAEFQQSASTSKRNVRNRNCLNEVQNFDRSNASG